MSNVCATKCEIDEALWAAYRRCDKREVTANLLSRWLAAVELSGPLLIIPNTLRSESASQHYRSRFGTLEHGLTIRRR
jgi:hypothetical protein